MADDNLRLAAEVVDKFSVPLRDFTRQLQALNKLSQQQQKEGVVGTKEHIKWMGELRQTTHRLSDEVKGVLTPAMAAFGLGSLSVAGAIAAITKSVVDFGGAARNLSNLSHFSGLTVQDVRVYEELAAALGSSKTEMDGFITSFSTSMDQWRRLGRGPMADFFATQPAEIRNIGIALRHTADNAQALGLVFDFLADTRYTAVQKKILTDAIGMPAAFAHAGAGARELYAKLNAEVKPLDKGWEERKQRYLESMALLSASWSNLSLHIGDTMSTSFADMADTIRKFIDENGPEIRKFFVDFAKDVGDVGGAARDIVTGLGMLRDIVKEFREGEPIDLQKFIEFSGLEQTLEIFVAVWKARWSEFKASLGLGSDTDAGADEVARREVLRKYRPGEVEEEDRAAAARAKTDTREIAKQKELTPGWQPSDKTELQRLRDWWNGTPGPNFRGQGYGGSATTTPPPGAISPPPGQAPGTISPPPKKMNYTVPENSGAGIIKASYTGGFESEGPNPLRAAQSSIKFPTEETLGGGASSTSDAINVIATGTRKGVYDGMIDYYQYLLGTKSGAGGVTPASFGGSSGAAAGGGIDTGGGGAEEPGGATAPGGPPVGKENLGAGEKPAHFDLAAIRSAVTGTSPTGGGSAYLARERADLAADIAAHPGDRATLRGMLVREDARDPTGPMEALANRWAYLKSIGKHPTIHSMLHSGFYGSGDANHPMGPNKKYDAAIDRVLGGSNKLQGAADQGTYGDPNSNYILRHWRAQYPGMSPSAIYGDWAAGASKAFRLRDQAAMREFDAKEKQAVLGADHAGNSTMPDVGMLLKHARNAGVVGTQGSNKVTGNLGVRIDLNGFPRGTKTSTEGDDIFNPVALNRGATPRADQGQ